METAFNKFDDIGVFLAPEPLITVLGVKYLHLRMEDGSDLYVTEYGRPFTKSLLPENHWIDQAWVKEHGIRLPGTSAVYRLPTKEVEGESKDIVIKWNRMGQDIPGETRALDADNAEFNSPFMEFSLVLELRNTKSSSGRRLLTHKPWAIYVPRKYVEGERLGRRKHKMRNIHRVHEAEIAIDWNRNYAVIYEWLKGVDTVEAMKEGLLDNQTLSDLLQQAEQDLADRGFTVSDSKPQHVIVRPSKNNGLVKDRQDKCLYGLVDFELLKRTPEREKQLRAEKRHEYLVRQAHRFEQHEAIPEGLSPVCVMGVDYVYGQVESTGGGLWIVGRDPMLFDYFQPEKWRRTPRTCISNSQRMYETITKDNVHLVWRLSRVGQVPDADPIIRREARILAYGYNSPFEEFAIAMELNRRGIETTYPRAIYMTGHRASIAKSLVDESRYQSHKMLQTPNGHPLLSRYHEYVSIWGYWNGPDEALANKDEEVYKGIDALAAFRSGRLTKREYVQVVLTVKKRLAEADIEDLSLRGNHLLLSINRQGELAADDLGLPLVRICNFEMLKMKMPEIGDGSGKIIPPTNVAIQPGR